MLNCPESDMECKKPAIEGQAFSFEIEIKN